MGILTLWANPSTVLLCAVALSLGACKIRTHRTPDDTVVMLIETEVRDIDPRFARTNHDIKVSRLVAPGLTSVDQESLEPKLALARAVEQVDALTWDVYLRRDARFSTGVPVVASDVEFTYQSTMDERTKSLYHRGFRERFHSVKAVATDRVRFRLKVPLGTFLTDLDFGIVSQKAADKNTGLFAAGHVVGAGPYRVFVVSSFRCGFDRKQSLLRAGIGQRTEGRKASRTRGA